MNISILQKYQQRLTNLSSRNRALKLLKPSTNKDIDFFSFAFEETKGHHELLHLLVNHKKILLINKLNPHDEKTSTLDKQLNQIYRTVQSIERETGLYPLKVGYPFIQGKFLNEAIARCPMILFPYRLVKNPQNQNRWYLEPDKNDTPHWNSVFFLALEQFHQIKLSDNFWETELPSFENLQFFWNWLYEQLKTHDIPLKWNVDVFQEPYKMFSNFQSNYVKNFPLGELKIMPEAVLGLFPETDTALFEDYDYLIKNSIQLENHSAFQSNLSNDSKPNKFLPITDLDASQEKVLIQALKGNNLVIQGPPGTGKSQWIINFIAENISKGKKVLVVSQKKAALDVVYHRLEKLGLNTFTTLVHDPQLEKMQIYQRWFEILKPIIENQQININFSNDEFENLENQFESQLDYFQKFYADLWDDKPFGISLSELYTIVVPPQKPWSEQLIPNAYTYSDLKKFISLLREVALYKKYLSPEHPWYHRNNLANFTYFEIIEKLEYLPQIIQKIYDSLQSVAYKGYYLMEITNLQEIIDSYFYCNELFENDKKFYALYSFLTSDNQSIKKVKSFIQFYEENKAKFEKKWWLTLLQKEKIKDLIHNMDTYFAISKSFFRFLNPEWWYISNHWKKIYSDNELNFSDEALKKLKNEILEYQDFIKFVEENPWVELEKNKIEFAIDFFNRMIFDSLKPRFTNFKLDEQHWSETIQYFTKLKEVKNEWELIQKSLETWLSNHQIQLIFSEIYANKFPLELIKQWKNSFQTDGHDIIHLDKILSKFNFVDKSIFDKSVKSIFDYPDTNNWIQMIENQVYWNWIQKLEKLNPRLSEISTKSFEWKSNQLREVYDSYQKQFLQKIFYKLVNDLTQYFRENPKNLKEICYQVKKKRSLWSLRKMVEQYCNKGIEYLSPCWLASPEAVSAIFPMKTNLFDWVIFDEASQCYVEKAIPVMYRAQKVIIIGDSKQLQPYNLYEIKIDNQEENESIENDILNEIESLLSYAEHQFSNTKLLWHYRAENEVLIQFSNQNFYHNELRFVPYPKTDERFIPPMEWVHVNGIWDKNTNLIEAQKVIEILESLVQNNILCSVGIITFNYYQQQLILDLIDQKLLSLNPNSEQYLKWNCLLNYDGIESLFVKNIENVQGDERDVIIFSVGYGYNKEGKFIQQFGSLSQKSGENRLNVAVSRAKKKIYLVTSIEPEDIKPELTSAGALLLRDYLRFVKQNHTHSNLTNPIKNKTNSILAQSIAKELQKFPEIQYYFPNDGMDLAIIDSQNQKYIAVLCEDGIIKKSQNIKEIEIYLPKLLKHRRWEVKKVFAKQWLLDRTKVIQELVNLS